MTSIFKKTFALSALALQLAPAGLAHAAACVCDPDTSFSARAEVALPVAASGNVDVNLGNSPANFVTAAYEQINGTAPSAAIVNAQVNNLTTLPYWRRIDTVNTFLNAAGSGKGKTYSDPWTSDFALTSAPCKTVTRDIGAVCMFFFGCVGGVNCQMNWANTHANGMDLPSPILGYGGNGTGIYNSSVNTGFWYRELMDARYAGLQFLMPNVYGPDLANGSVANLAAALANIAGQGLSSQVKIALFDDTSGWNSGNGAPWSSIPTFSNPAAAAAAIFNNKWKPFFQGIPQAYWYTVPGTGRPLVYFYNAGTLTPLNQSAATIAQLKSLFAAQFGVTPYVVVDKAYFADGAMPSTADNEFVWDTLHASPALTNNISSYNFSGIRWDHALVKWDPLGRNYYNNTVPNLHIANAGDGIIKDASYLTAALNNSGPSGDNASVLVLGTWNDIGEGTGINRNYDYYVNGAWQPPNYFMNYIRASQSQQTCGVILPTVAPTPVQTPLVTDFESSNASNKATEWYAGNILTSKDTLTSTLVQYPWTYASTVAGNGSAHAGRINGVLAAQNLAAGQYPFAYLALELNPGGSVPANANTNVLPESPNKGLSFDFKAGTPGVQYRVDLVEHDGVTTFAYTYFQFLFTAPDTNWHTVTVYFPGVSGGGFRFARPGGGTFDPTVLGAVIFAVQPVNGATVTYDLSVDNVTFAVPPAPPAIDGPLISDFDTNNAQIGTVTEWNNGNILTARDGYGTTLAQYPWKWSSGTTGGNPGAAGRISGTLAQQLTATAQYPYAYLGLELKPGGSIPAAANVDVSLYAPNQGLHFDFKAGAANVQYRVDLVEKDGATTFAYSYFQYVFTSTDTAWHSVDVYFPNEPGGAYHFSRPGGGVFDPTKLGAVLFQVQPQNGATVAYDLTVDNVGFNSPTPPTPTPTATPSASPTATRSASPTNTATPTPIATATPSASPSSSPTPTSTSSGTGTSSPTRTASPTASRSASPSSTATLTPSPTASGTVSPLASTTPSNTATPSATLTASSSSSATRTATQSFTASPSATRSATPTASPSATPTRSPSPTSSPSFTAVPVGSSPTVTPTVSPSFSASPSRTASPSATGSATPSHSASPSSTATMTPSPLATQTGSPTATLTPTGSRSASPSPSASLTLSPAMTATPSATAAQSPTLTSTVLAPLPTATPTLSPPATPTGSPSPPATAAPSATPSSTPLATVQSSATVSVTPGSSATSSATPLSSATLTLSPLASLTVTPTWSPTLSPSPSGTPLGPPVATATSTRTALPGAGNGGDGPLNVKHVQVVPQPVNSGSCRLHFELEGPAESLQIKIYNKAMLLLSTDKRVGSYGLGWNQETLALPDLGNGLYYLVVTVQRGERTSDPVKPARVYVLR